MATAEQKPKEIVLIGLPNTGKSQVFNNLTRQYTLVSNSPMTTVEMKRAACRIDNQPCEVIDTPGLHSLYIHSEEELAVRDMLFAEQPDVLVQCVDTNRLKQSLTLTAGLLELGIPMVLMLNAIDETTRRGLRIDSAELSKQLGIPVIESVAINGLGTEDLKRAVLQARRAKSLIRYGSIIEEGLGTIAAKLPPDLPYKRKLSLLLLKNDPFLLKELARKYGKETASGLEKDIRAVHRQFKGHLGLSVNNKRNKWVNDLFDKVVRKQKLSMGGFSQTFAQLSRHPIFGVPIFLGVIFIVYFLIVDVANVLAAWMGTRIWGPIEALIDHWVPQGFWNDFLIGHYGILSLGLANAVLTVLPILSVFFLAFNTLEDTGYIPNLSVLTKRLLEKIGLSGSAIMPLVLGFGCKTMATLTTKSLKSRKERYIAIYLIAFAIPCAAQTGLNISILGHMGLRAFAITFLFLGTVEILAGLCLNRILKEKEARDDFLQELPPIRVPNLKAVLKKTYYRLVWFLKEAVPVFVVAALVLFTADKIGLLNALKILLRPVIEGFLGLPLNMVDALILCMARQEAAAGMIIRLIEHGQLDYIQCIVAVSITTMTIPCFANIGAMVKELGMRQALGMAIIINVSSFVVAGLLHWGLVFTIGR